MITNFQQGLYALTDSLTKILKKKNTQKICLLFEIFCVFLHYSVNFHLYQIHLDYNR